MKIPINSLRLDGDTQSRDGVKQEIVNEYAEDMREGAVFPPVVVYDDGESKWLSEGFHRLHAARQVGAQEIEAEVRQGSKRDAQLNSMRSNATHGARRTNADKRRAVEMAFRWLIEEGRSLKSITNVEISAMAAVGESTAARMKVQIVAELEINPPMTEAQKITNSDLTVTAKLKDELARAKEKIALLETLRQGHKEHDESRDDELEKLRREALEWERKALEAANTHAVEPEKVIVERIVEKEVTPPAVEAKLREQENLIYELQRREAGNPRLEEKRNAILKEIEQLREERSKTRGEASFDGVISLIMNQKALAQNIVDLAKNGDLTIQQMDEAQNLMSNVIAAANDVLHELRVIRGEFKKGGGLRAL